MINEPIIFLKALDMVPFRHEVSPITMLRQSLCAKHFFVYCIVYLIVPFVNDIVSAAFVEIFFPIKMRAYYFVKFSPTLSKRFCSV